MFTFLATLVVVIFGLSAHLQRRHDPPEMSTAILQSRQELRVISYLLVAITILLGVIADKIH
jgi:hypothetical protein